MQDLRNFLCSILEDFWMFFLLAIVSVDERYNGSTEGKEDGRRMR